MKWAQSLGATLVEFDVQITKDDALVLMHDSTVDATTNGTGEVAKMTLAEIKALWVDGHAQAEPVRVPTFEEVLIAFKDSDMVLNIEIKCGDTDLVPIMVDQIRQYEMTDRVRVCCFYDNQIQAMREYAPEIPTSVISNSMNSFEELISRATKFESAYFVKFDQFDYDNLQKLAYRGVGAFLWTPDNHEHIYTSYAEGPWSLCLNWVDRIAENACRLETGASSYSLTAGGSVAASLLATSYKGELVDTSKAEMVIISGNQSLSYENGSISADETGTATVMFRMPVTLSDKSVSTNIIVYIYTAPVTVTVS
jgi:glycerophosphoryl diester phosphodiesterase